MLGNILTYRVEKTIHEEEASNVDVAEMMADLKVIERI